MICPACGQADPVEKVSIIYMRGIEAKWRHRKAVSASSDEAPIRRSLLVDAMPADELQILARRLAPPAAKKEVPVRAIHPDLVVLTFSLVAPIFFYGILTTQPSGFWIVLPLLAVFYAFYFWQRKSMVAKFQAQEQAKQAAADRVQRGIQRWMRLYYCADDDGVFEPGSQTLTPADQIAGYLFKN